MYAYIHIPFCMSKCAYCDFFSIPIESNSSCTFKHVKKDLNSNLIPDSYIDALLAEAAFKKQKYSVDRWQTIYIGGGTPSLLTVAQLERLLVGLMSLCACAKDVEITLEANCADIANSVKNKEGYSDYLKQVALAGVNRISCGIQSLDDESLKAVGRRSSVQEARKALLALQKWRDFLKNTEHTNVPRQFSVDIIAGLPKLTDENFLSGLNEILLYKPDHISLYSLIIEEGTPLCTTINSGLMDFDDDIADSQWLIGRDMLKKAEYIQYEVSNFAKKQKGFLCEGKHNSAYWRMDDYIGLGAGACGTVGAKRFTGTTDIRAYCDYWNTVDVQSFVETPQDISFAESITEDERIMEFLMMGFRTLRGVDSDDFFYRFSIPIEKKIGFVFSQWQQKNLAHRIDNFYALTEEGLLFLNQFLKEIL